MNEQNSNESTEGKKYTHVGASEARKMKNMRREGLSLDEIAKNTGRSPMTVWRKTKRVRAARVQPIQRGGAHNSIMKAIDEKIESLEAKIESLKELKKDLVKGLA